MSCGELLSHLSILMKCNEGKETASESQKLNHLSICLQALLQCLPLFDIKILAFSYQATYLPMISSCRHHHCICAVWLYTEASAGIILTGKKKM